MGFLLRENNRSTALDLSLNLVAGEKGDVSALCQVALHTQRH